MVNIKFSREIEEAFKKAEVSLKYPLSSRNIPFKSLKSLHAFLLREQEAWQTFNEGLASTVRGKFQNASREIENIQSITDPNQLAPVLNNIQSQFANHPMVIYSNTAAFEVVRSTFSTYQENIHGNSSPDAVWSYYNPTSPNQSANINLQSRGLLDIYFSCWFAHRIDEGKIPYADIPMAGALEQLRSDFQKSIDDSYEHFTSSRQELEQKLVEITEKAVHDSENAKAELIRIVEESKSRVDELEKFHRERVQLSIPSEQWKELGREYSHSGWIWTGISIFLGFGSALLICYLVFNAPDILFGSSDAVSAARGTIIVGFMATLLIFILRLTIRLATSAFHLQKDAKERHKLTNVYLSLLKENAILPEERPLVLQSLFSRADTGLVKGDGPTMPETGLSKVMGLMQGKG